MKEIYIDSHYQSSRLDKFLRRLFVQASGGFVYKMLRKKNITLNDKKANGNEVLKTGDIIKIYFSDETYKKLTSAGGTSVSLFNRLSELHYDIDIIHEDDELIIADKPKGMLSQKAKEDDVSINEYLLAYMIHSGQLSLESMSKFTPSVVNRLDRNTSGLIIFAKTYACARQVTQWIKEHSVKKTYRCIVYGECPISGSVISYIKKDKSANKVEVFDRKRQDTLDIETIYRPIKTNGKLTLLEATLVTGRSHQIRSQISNLGYPILFDPKYGYEVANERYHSYGGSDGQLLHAYRLVLPDGREFTSDPPAIFEELLKEV